MLRSRVGPVPARPKDYLFKIHFKIPSGTVGRSIFGNRSSQPVLGAESYVSDPKFYGSGANVF
jgi:hypothetical protein